MNLYYEIAPAATAEFGSQYIAEYDVPSNNLGLGFNRRAMMMANRVWQESRHGVVFYKNRYSCAVDTPVDMKEFFWIKLRSTAL